ncbi:MAG: aldo/keto reductase, partial [Deltaproteobacteria bacterium]|nr:aldo/keto reductase [Deltaproteobacteria bacterium]
MGHNQLHDLQVSPPCLGCMNFGTYTEESRSRQLLDCYIDSGGNFLDTANNYACWQPGASGDESESVLGRWMQQRNNRQRIILATKVGFNQPAIGEGLTPSIIKSEIDKSLQRLKTDYIDLYYAHNDDRSTPLEETLHTFAQLVQSGKVRYIGASNTMAWRLEQAHNISQTNKWPSYCCIQQRFTYLRPRPGAHFGPQ